MPHVRVGIPATPARHHTPCLARLESFPVGKDSPAREACIVPFHRQLGQTPRRGIPPADTCRLFPYRQPKGPDCADGLPATGYNERLCQ
jgi:hypothetical protein